MRRTSLVSCAVFAGLLVGTLAASPVDATFTSNARRSGVGCPMSHVHYTPYPGVENGLASIPWIASAGTGLIKASLFYYGGVPWRTKHLLGARIFTTQRHHNINPKVLWTIRASGRGPTIMIRGRRIDGRGSFSATYPSAGYDYPSYVKVPYPGCWRVSVTSGRLRGSVVFAAVNY